MSKDQRTSFKAIRFVSRNKSQFKINNTAFNIWLVMADDYPYYTKDGKNYAPSFEKLAVEIDSDERTVRRNMTKLEEAGLITAVSKKRGCATWWEVKYTLEEVEALLKEDEIIIEVSEEVDATIDNVESVAYEVTPEIDQSTYALESSSYHNDDMYIVQDGPCPF